MAKVQNTKAPVRKIEDEEKQKALKTAMDQIEKKFGKGAVMRLTIRPVGACRLV
jgi:Ribonuclease G/E